MATCQSCGGVIGRDCFNPEECAWIGHQQEMAAQQNMEEAHHSLQQLKAEIAAIATELDAFGPGSCDGVRLKRYYDFVGRLRQLSAV